MKSVSFNLNDPFESEMYEYSQRFSNFSSFIKRLIHNSINCHVVNSQLQKSTLSVERPLLEQPVINQEYLKQLI